MLVILNLCDIFALCIDVTCTLLEVQGRGLFLAVGPDTALHAQTTLLEPNNLCHSAALWLNHRD